MAVVKGAEGGKKREQEYELDQQNRALDTAACDDVKKYLKSCKSGIGFHNFRHNNILILNFNFKILASHFLLFVECLIVYGRIDRIRAIGSEESPSHSQWTAGYSFCPV